MMVCMKETNKSHFFKKERLQTDTSLATEREQANESFESIKQKVEQGTDQKFEEGRQAADRVRAQRRQDSDESLSSNIHIASERRQEDTAIQAERKSTDEALEKERIAKKGLLNKLVGGEREATDKNLLDERTQTDVTFEKSGQLLTAEQQAHGTTKAALTTREEFLAVVSHDLRNPMGAISSCAEMLMNDSSFSHVDEEVKNWIRFIKRNADTSLRLISDILDMERIAEGKLGVKIQDHRIEDLVRDAVENQAHVASSKSILLRAVPKKISQAIRCDGDRIAQVLSNLIGNALKFTPDGGAVTVEIEESRNDVQVTVTDNGPGIAADKIDNIFERFAQLHNKDRRGLGLGLYISKMLVEVHDGEIWVNSKVGQGSQFGFRIPKQGPAQVH